MGQFQQQVIQDEPANAMGRHDVLVDNFMNAQCRFPDS
jgi:saccharopepsin